MNGSFLLGRGLFGFFHSSASEPFGASSLLLSSPFFLLISTSSFQSFCFLSLASVIWERLRWRVYVLIYPVFLLLSSRFEGGRWRCRCMISELAEIERWYFPDGLAFSLL